MTHSSLLVSLTSLGLSPEDSKQLTSGPTPAPASTGNPATQLEKCLPVSVAVSGKEDVSGPLVDTKPLLHPTGDKREDEHQPMAPIPAEFGSNSLSKFSSQTALTAAKATEETTQVEGERSHATCPEPPEKENRSMPKSPASAGVGSCPGEESRAHVTKETPSHGIEEMDTGVQGLKRKSQSPEEALTAPEKRPHISENCSSQSSFQSSSQPFPTAPVPKVPPLRVTKSFAWLHLHACHSCQLTGPPFQFVVVSLPLGDGGGGGKGPCRKEMSGAHRWPE